jgi:hypothetical protein
MEDKGMNDRKQTAANGGAAVFSVRLSAVCFLTLIFRFSLSERQELELAQIVG